jgi:hypothetical protein
MGLLRLRRVREPELDEQAAYARCHGARDESVRIVSLPPRRDRDPEVLAIGEVIRRRFEERLGLREPDVAAVAEEPAPGSPELLPPDPVGALVEPAPEP